MIKKILFLVVFFLILFQGIKAQETTPIYSKNYIYFDGGLTLGAFGGITYERVLLDKVKWNTISVSGGIGYHGMLMGSDAYSQGPFANVKANFCLRAKSHNLELGLGACLLLALPEVSEIPYDVGGTSYTLPDFSLGYKYQKPGKKFLFKTSIGFPKLWGVGIGYAF